MFAWQDFVAAVGLVLVFEGTLAAANPGLIKAAARAYLAASPRQLRLAGLVAVVVGLAVVATVRMSP
ncbi:MAG: DUF2065 family protein [Alphaproteobacteria bacterium]|nr:MAG: DUF2065 family protein [Alphaproteobacteria bacterium]